MMSQDIIQYAGLILAIIAIIVSLFTKSIRDWIIRKVSTLASFISVQMGYLWFRSILLLVFHILLMFVLYKVSYISLEFAVTLSLVFAVWLGGFYFISHPSRKRLEKIDIELNRLQTEVHVLTQSRKIELESIQNKWSDFVAMLSTKPGYEVISAYLNLAKPVHLESDSILIGLPEVMIKTSEGVDLKRVVPLIKSFFGNPYTLRTIVYNQSADEKSQSTALAVQNH